MKKTSRISLKMSELKPGDRGIVTAIDAQGEITQRLVDMGIIKGTFFEVLRKAPLGDPLEIRLGGFLLALRLNEAKYISVLKQKN